MKVERNWRVVALTDHGTVELEVDGERRDSGELPSEWGVTDYMGRAECAVIRSGLMAAGNTKPGLLKRFEAWRSA